MPSALSNPKFIAAGAGLLILVVFVALNFRTVEINFLFFQTNTRLAFALLLTAGLGFLIGLVVARMRSPK